MKKVIGIFVLLVVVIAATSIMEPLFLDKANIQNILRLTGLYGIMAIGVAFVIITGGIDLSVGAVVGLVGTLLPMLLRAYELPVPVALIAVLGISMGIGLIHGLLITKLTLQPFVVTLCGLFIYRGLARFIAGDATQGFGGGFENLRYLANGMPFSVPMILPNVSEQVTPNDTGSLFVWISIPMPFIWLILIAILTIILLNASIYGRYIFALGRNEVATRFSGINTDRMVILSYLISSTMAGFAGILFVLYLNSVQPSGHGNFFELYAIAGCVLGGCSLRGGEGTIIGVIIGTAIVRVLYNAINMLGIATQLEFAVIGTVILVGVIADEVFKRLNAARRAAWNRAT